VHEDAFLQALTEPSMMRADDWSTPIVVKSKATLRASLTRSSTEIYQFAGVYDRLAA
jgi:hypothetical protein